MVVHSGDSRLITANQTALRLLGWELKAVTGALNTDPCWDFLREDGSAMPVSENPVERAMRQGAPIERVVLGIVHRKDRTVVWVSVNAYPVVAPSGAVERVVTSFTDVTELRNAKLDLENALEDAARSARATSEFLANTSHEIRTPLTAVLGFAALIERGVAVGEEAKDYAHKITAAGSTLLELLNDIIDLSALEAMALPLRPSGYALRSLLDAALANVEGEATQKGLTLKVRIASNVPEHVLLDGLRVKQVLTNLLKNAVKFAEAGHVAVDASYQEDGQVSVAISDTGVGIAPEMKERIFDRFVQERATLTREHGGAGLGLAISRSLIALMGGTLEVQSARRRLHLRLDHTRGGRGGPSSRGRCGGCVWRGPARARGGRPQNQSRDRGAALGLDRINGR